LEAIQKSLEPTSQVTLQQSRAMRRQMRQGAEYKANEGGDESNYDADKYPELKTEVELRDKRYSDLQNEWKQQNNKPSVANNVLFRLHDEASLWAQEIITRRKALKHPTLTPRKRSKSGRAH
jgi:hypothetical protein